MVIIIKRALALAGLILMLSLLGLVIFLVTQFTAAFMPEADFGVVMTITSISIFGGMLGITLMFGRMLKEQTE